MKPAILTAEKQGIPVEIQPQTPSRSVPSSRKRWLVYAGLFVMLAVIGTLAVLTYINTLKTKDSESEIKVNINGVQQTKKVKGPVEANLTYHIVPSGEEIKEKIVVDDNEEDISTPNARMIYDFSSGHIIFKHKDDDICYVSDFNQTMNIDEIREGLQQQDQDEYVHENLTEVVYESTGETVDRSLLPPRAAEMCANSEIVEVAMSDTSEDNQLSRGKRSICRSCVAFCWYCWKLKKVKVCKRRWFRRKCYYKYQYVRSICCLRYCPCYTG